MVGSLSSVCKQEEVVELVSTVYLVINFDGIIQLLSKSGVDKNINPNRVPIEWAEFLSLCVSCGLTKRALANDKYSFWYGNIGGIHQAKGQDGGQFKNQGYFIGVYGNFW